MELTVVQIGDVTSNGNNIVKLQRKVEQDSAVGTINRQQTYYVAVKAGTVKVVEGESVELDLNEYQMIEREFEHPETQEIMMLKWLHLK